MTDLMQETKERLDEWERQLRLAVGETQAEQERQRIQRQLMEISTRRDQLEQLDPQQLATLHKNLAKDPRGWIRHQQP